LQFGLPPLTKATVPPDGFKIAFPWLAVVGTGTTFVAGWIASWLTPQRVVSDEKGLS
jgi:hypothetical protein